MGGCSNSALDSIVQLGVISGDTAVTALSLREKLRVSGSSRQRLSAH
jgi:hypothetical protein